VRAHKKVRTEEIHSLGWTLSAARHALNDRGGTPSSTQASLSRHCRASVTELTVECTTYQVHVK
jgi:hypothetical protein